MLGWFKKKKTVDEDTVSVNGAIAEHETNAAEFDEQAPEQENEKGLFKRLQESLSKTRDSLVSRVDNQKK